MKTDRVINRVVFILVFMTVISSSYVFATTIYYDFENGSTSGWELGLPEITSYKETVGWKFIEDDTLVWEGVGGTIWGGGNSVQFLSDFESDSLTVSADVKVIDARHWNGLHRSGIVAGLTDKNHFYGFFIEGNAQNVSLMRGDYELGIHTNLETWHSDTSFFGEWQNLKLEIVGNHFFGYLNDQLIIDVVDALYSGGSVGILNAGAVTRFDNFEVDTTTTPEPTTIVILSFGLVGLAGLRRKRFFTK